ncbi:unnamed protein product [Fusarium graminearum]|nr:unnamed protein product [Fusarium graminearum]
MDPLSITAGVAGIAVPALQCVEKLRSTIKAILDVPSDIASLGEELLTIEQAITSIQQVSDQQWRSLGEPVVTQSKTAMNLCRKSCSKFQAAIDYWTRHGKDGKLSWRDRTEIGLFRQDHIKSTSSQLQNCIRTLTSVQSLNLLKILDENIQSTAKDIRKGQSQVVNTISFGDYNKGIQTGISNAPINFYMS